MKTAFYNGKIYTGEETLKQAFLIEGGRIIRVGSDAEILSEAGSGSALHDLQGRFVCPGFNDSHMHLLNYGKVLGSANLFDHTDSLSGMIRYMKSFAASHPPKRGQWLFGRGWNQDLFRDVSRMPGKHDLDSISTAYPIVLTRACGHSCVVNSAVLQIAGITSNSASPEGGAIGMEGGEPDGRLYDNAIELLNPFIPLPGPDDLKEMIRSAAKSLNSYGITSVQTDDYGVFRNIPKEAVNAAFRELEEAGELTVRVYEQANILSVEELARFMDSGNGTGKGSDFFKIGPLKIVADGSLGSRTAFLSRPYADLPENRGLLLLTEKELNELISFANENDQQIAVHTIGDGCLDLVLEAFEKALRDHPRRDHRHGVVHCQITRPDQLKKLRELDLCVYAQSVFLDYDNHIVEKRVGPVLASTSYSWKTLMESGVSVSNGSDCPVELPDVMKGIECAVTRTSMDGTGPYLPVEAFTVKEALDSFTIRGAEASFEEDRKGLIAPEYLADFTVLDENPFESEPKELHKIRVHACYLGGRCVFERSGD
ncbi:MAG: amidohydrolase [Lachnospiraceae bacterium]|nr:amidohydrolase [Lachnospiraceae bacterium]